MRTIGLVVMAAALMTGPALGQAAAQARASDASTPPDPLKLHIDDARAAPQPNATVRYGADDLRAGTIRLPQGKGRFPVVMLVHGGCWTKGYADRASMEGVSAALAARGIAVWNVEYRQAGDPGGGWPGTFDDIAAAADYLPVLARRYPIDLKRVAFVGHSAGAHLALWAASRPRLDGAWRRAKVRAQSVVAIDGPGSLAPLVGADQEICGKPVIVPFMGGEPLSHAAQYRQASPSNQLPLGVRTLLVKAGLAQFMTPYAAAARAAGDPVEELAPANANHFDIVTPSTANGAKVIDFIVTRAFAKE